MISITTFLIFGEFICTVSFVVPKTGLEEVRAQSDNVSLRKVVASRLRNTAMYSLIPNS